MSKSFIIHKDSLSVLDELTNEQAGVLFRAIKAFQLGEELELDALTKIAFAPFKSQFIRDLDKYNETCDRNRRNGKIGGRPRKEEKPTETQKTQVVFEKPKKADSKSKNKNDSKNDNDKELFHAFMKLYPGTKRGLDTEYDNFCKKHKDHSAVIHTLHEIINNQLRGRALMRERGLFVPEWKMLSTWINQRCWEEEYAVEEEQMSEEEKRRRNYKLELY